MVDVSLHILLKQKVYFHKERHLHEFTNSLSYFHMKGHSKIELIVKNFALLSFESCPLLLSSILITFLSYYRITTLNYPLKMLTASFDVMATVVYIHYCIDIYINIFNTAKHINEPASIPSKHFTCVERKWHFNMKEPSRSVVISAPQANHWMDQRRWHDYWQSAN